MADSILVLGATGTIGQLVVSELVTKGETVKAAALDGQTHPDASVLRFDYRDPASIAPLFEGVDRVFVLMPSTPLDIIDALMPVMRHVVDRKVKAVLLSTIAADESDDNPYRRLELVLENSGLPFVILRANWFADNFRTVWKDAVRTGELALPIDEGLISFVDGRDVAAASAAALTTSDFGRPDARAHRTRRVAIVTRRRSDEPTQRAVRSSSDRWRSPITKRVSPRRACRKS